MSAAGRDLGTLLTELQVYALTADRAQRARAVTALVTACAVAGPVARVSAGNLDLEAGLACRALDLARAHGDPGLIGFARWFWACNLVNLGARDRARTVASTGIDELTPAVRLTGEHTLAAEMLGFLHASLGWIAALAGRADDTRAHLDEIALIAGRIGERNGMRRHFGPTNVRLWRLEAGVELADGGRAYAEITRAPLDVAALGSAERTSSLHLNLARALAQDGPDHDLEAIRHLDTADRLAPQRMRMYPVARDLVTELDRRTKRRVWELDSLCHRFGLSVPG